MKMTLGLTAMASLSLAAVAVADNHEDGISIVPVETYTCDYREGKSRADLQPAIDAWNAFMDENGTTDYFATMVTPDFVAERQFDVGWLGAWKDGNGMGAELDVWNETGDEVGAGFYEVIDCKSRSMFATMPMKPGDGENDDDNKFLLTFANCSARDGVDFDDVMKAQAEWAEYQTENGFKLGSWMMFPVFGDNGDYAFKMVEGHNNYTALGADFQLMADGHWRKSSELLDSLVSCDVARVYQAEVVREME